MVAPCSATTLVSAGLVLALVAARAAASAGGSAGVEASNSHAQTRHRARVRAHRAAEQARRLERRATGERASFVYLVEKRGQRADVDLVEGCSVLIDGDFLEGDGVDGGVWGRGRVSPIGTRGASRTSKL